MTMLSSGSNTPRLLVVEDDDTIRETVCEALELEGFNVIPATNGQSAWDRLKKEPFELIEIGRAHV